MPTFSVIIPVYNRGALVKETIDSALDQTYTDYEVIVVDDGSTDDTPGVLAAYADRIKVICQKNQGPEVARNTGAASATGEYLTFLDSDDLMFPWTLEVYDRVVTSQGRPGVVLSNLKFFDRAHPANPGAIDLSEIRIIRYENLLSKDRTLRTSASIIIVKHTVFDELNGFRHSTPETYYYDDLDFILRMGAISPAFVVLSPPLVAYRIHETNIVHDIESNYRGIREIIRAEKRGAYPAGGAWLKFKRYAFIGGPAIFSCKKAISKGHHFKALKIFISGFFMILAAVARQAILKTRPALEPIVLAQDPRGG